MKKLIALIAVCCVLIQALSKTTVWVSFITNSEYIGSFLCVNRDVPAKKCHGKCFLKDQLKKDTERGGQERDQKRIGATEFFQFFEIKDSVVIPEISSTDFSRPVYWWDTKKGFPDKLAHPPWFMV